MFPTLFKIGNFEVRAWGVFVAIGFILAEWRAASVSKKYGIASERVIDLGFLACIFGVLGARFGFVIDNWNLYANRMGDIFNFRDGGLSFFGGLILAFIACFIYISRKKLPFWDVVDMLSISVVIGYAVGRIGCFFNGCCYGSPTHLPWGCGFHDDMGYPTPPSHPAQIYSTLIHLIFYFVLTRMEKKRAFSGIIFGTFLILHGIYRFVMEFVRMGATASPSFAWVTTGHLIAGLLALSGVVIILLRRNTGLPIVAEQASEPK